MKAETIAKLFRGCRDDGEKSRLIERMLNEIETTKRRLLSYQENVRAEERRRVATDQTLRSTLMEIQSKCPHLETTFFGDAAGGSDSHTSCDLCGKEMP
jgi:hypothetical protein